MELAKDIYRAFEDVVGTVNINIDHTMMYFPILKNIITKSIRYYSLIRLY